jgi:hypothetical protein
MAKSRSKKLVVCIDNEGYPASIEKRKIYLALRDPAAEKHGLVRVIDESGEITCIQRCFSARSHCRRPPREPCWPLRAYTNSACSARVESRTRSRFHTWSHFLSRVKKGGNMEKHGNKPDISLSTRLKRFFLIFLFVCPALFVFVYLALFVIQRHLLFPTHIANASRLRTPADYYLLDFNETALTASDGVKIGGWNRAPTKDMPVILYFHGNGENIAARAERYAAFAEEGYGVFRQVKKGCIETPAPLSHGSGGYIRPQESFCMGSHSVAEWPRKWRKSSQYSGWCCKALIPPYPTASKRFAGFSLALST